MAEYGYYRRLGTDARRFGGTSVCDNRPVRSDRLEQAAWEEIRAPLEDPGRIAGLRERPSRAREQRRALTAAAEAERGPAPVVGRVEDFAAEVRRGLDELDWPGTRAPSSAPSCAESGSTAMPSRSCSAFRR